MTEVADIPSLTTRRESLVHRLTTFRRHVVRHLLFAAVTTAYIFVGIFLEERDLIQLFGVEYNRYRAQVGMLIPFLLKWS